MFCRNWLWSIEFSGFWLAPCSVMLAHQRLHFNPEDGGSTLVSKHHITGRNKPETHELYLHPLKISLSQHGPFSLPVEFYSYLEKGSVVVDVFCSESQRAVDEVSGISDGLGRCRQQWGHDKGGVIHIHHERQDVRVEEHNAPCDPLGIHRRS